VHFQRNEQLIVVLALGVFILLGCAATSAVAAGCSMTTGAAGEASTVPPHPTRGVPSKTCASPMAGMGVPLLVHSCMRRSWIRLRLSWAMTSLLMAAAVLASA
jgi:hypothetical protein